MSLLNIHSQLMKDCYYLGQLAATDVLLHRNASLPWFILVPETSLSDLLDLPDEHREAVMVDCAVISRYIKQVLGFEKVNFAGLGNVVPQMHLHIIGRTEVDPCWPQPIWGHLTDSEPYDPERVRDWQLALVRMASLKPMKLDVN